MKRLIAILTLLLLVISSALSIAENDSQYLWDLPFGSSLEATKSELETLTGCTLEIVTSDNGTRALRNTHETKAYIPDLEAHDILSIDCFFEEAKPVEDKYGQISIQIVPSGLSDIYVSWAIGNGEPISGSQAHVASLDIYRYLYKMLGGDLDGYFRITFNGDTYYCPAYQDGRMSLALLDWVLQYNQENELLYIKNNCEIRLFGSEDRWFMQFHESDSPIFFLEDRVKDLWAIEGLSVPAEFHN